MTEHAHHTTHHQKHQDDNGLAIASLILGIVSLTGFGALTGIPAIITGVMSQKNPVNKGLGVAGLVMGIFSTVVSVLVFLFVILAILIAIASDTPPTQESPSDYSPSSSQTRNI